MTDIWAVGHLLLWARTDDCTIKVSLLPCNKNLDTGLQTETPTYWHELDFDCILIAHSYPYFVLTSM